jgi:hypothetical protein
MKPALFSESIYSANNSARKFMVECEEGKSGDPIYTHEQEIAHEHRIRREK